MELLIITAVQSFEKDIKRLLKENKVKVFSHLDVTGFKDHGHETHDENWFASSVGEYQSALFYAFVEDSAVDGVIQAIKNFNSSLDVGSHVHAAVMEVKKSV